MYEKNVEAVREIGQMKSWSTDSLGTKKATTKVLRLAYEALPKQGT